jgi:hypothetical protein
VKPTERFEVVSTTLLPAAWRRGHWDHEEPVELTRPGRLSHHAPREWVVRDAAAGLAFP